MNAALNIIGLALGAIIGFAVIWFLEERHYRKAIDTYDQAGDAWDEAAAARKEAQAVLDLALRLLRVTAEAPKARFDEAATPWEAVQRLDNKENTDD